MDVLGDFTDTPDDVVGMEIDRINLSDIANEYVQFGSPVTPCKAVAGKFYPVFVALFGLRGQGGCYGADRRNGCK
ncbi:hypothetical protein J4E05_07690 [Thalassospira sp. NFXS8]|uniref:hypothetical protein n=1 Tax=Thalassospira sp. NFXS8 TaxID=2819093 RepID=UPI0032DE9E60